MSYAVKSSEMTHILVSFLAEMKKQIATFLYGLNLWIRSAFAVCEGCVYMCMRKDGRCPLG